MSELLDRGAESRLSPVEIERDALDHCLGCRHCEAVCPSGVPYGALLEETRAVTGAPTGVRAGFIGFFLRHVLTNPMLLSPLMRVGELACKLPLPRLPAVVPRRRTSRLAPAPEAPAARTLILAGCAQRVVHPDVVPAVRVLASRCGQDTRVLRSPACCGALDAHVGALEVARDRGRRLIEACEQADLLLVPSAGCSAHLSRLGHLFEGDRAWHSRALAVADRCRDALSWFAEREVDWEFRPDPRRILYHPPCHHTHAQGLRGQAAGLLRQVPEVELLEAEEPERCCGSAGSYQLFWPQQASRVREEKVSRIQSQRPELVLSANPGCEIFLEEGLQALGSAPVGNVLVYLAERLVGLEARRS